MARGIRRRGRRADVPIMTSSNPSFYNNNDSYDILWYSSIIIIQIKNNFSRRYCHFFSLIVPIMNLRSLCDYVHIYVSRMSSFMSRQAIKTGKSLLLQQRRRNSSGSTADNGNLPSFSQLNTIPNQLSTLLFFSIRTIYYYHSENFSGCRNCSTCISNNSSRPMVRFFECSNHQIECF